MSELSRDARELIARARPAEHADPSAKERVRAALLPHLGVPPSAPALPPGPTATGVLGTSLSASKLVLICSLTAAGVVGTTALVKTRHAVEPSAASRSVTRTVPSAVSPLSPASPRAPALPSLAAPLLAVNEALPPPSLGREEPVRRISMRAASPRPSEPAEAPALARAPVNAPGRAAAAVPERSAAVAVPVPAAAVAVPVPPALHEAQPSLGPSPSWQSSPLPAPVPNREATRITLAPKPSNECTAERELRLLSGAQAALRASDGQRALDLLAEHAASCPSATFWEERSAARVLALCLLQRQPQALAEAQHLASLAPRSPLLARLRTSCASAAVKP